MERTLKEDEAAILNRIQEASDPQVELENKYGPGSLAVQEQSGEPEQDDEPEYFDPPEAEYEEPERPRSAPEPEPEYRPAAQQEYAQQQEVAQIQQAAQQHDAALLKVQERINELSEEWEYMDQDEKNAAQLEIQSAERQLNEFRQQIQTAHNNVVQRDQDWLKSERELLHAEIPELRDPDQHRQFIAYLLSNGASPEAVMSVRDRKAIGLAWKAYRHDTQPKRSNKVLYKRAQPSAQSVDEAIEEEMHQRYIRNPHSLDAAVVKFRHLHGNDKTSQPRAKETKRKPKADSLEAALKRYKASGKRLRTA